jgi:hypothetical protein
MFYIFSMENTQWNCNFQGLLPFGEGKDQAMRTEPLRLGLTNQSMLPYEDTETQGHREKVPPMNQETGPLQISNLSSSWSWNSEPPKI